MKIEAVTPWDWGLAERDLNESSPTGDCVAEGGSDWRNDAGEEGGAMKGNTTVVEWFRFSVTAADGPGNVDSGTKRACPILFLCL